MWQKLANIDRRIIYVLMIAVIALALIKPVGLAIAVSYTHLDVYKRQA